MARRHREVRITDEARAIVRAGAAPTTPLPELEQLNRDPMFRDVGIVWTGFRKRGRRVEGKSANGRTVIWESAGDVLKFSKSEAVVADALGVVLPKPMQGGLSWRLIAAVILRVAEMDRADLGDTTRLDIEEALQSVHNAANHPCPTREDQIFDLILQLRGYRRDPRDTDAPPCVFTFGGSVYVHQPTLRLWLSVPAGHNHLYSVSEIHVGLLAAEFVRVKDFRVQVEGKRHRIDLWKGPKTALGGDETEIITEDANEE
jgi:hypothetical protein